jgi:hypothetical protein
MRTPRNRRIAKVLADTNLIIPKQTYSLDEIYIIVKNNAELYPEDGEKERNGQIKWQHTVRRLIEEVNGKRHIKCIRQVAYNGDKEYIFT